MRRAVSLSVALTLLSFVVLLGGCSAPGAISTSPTATATTSPTATPVLTATYTSTDGVYKIGYPGAWTVAPMTVALTSGTAQIENAAGNDLVLVEPFTVKSAATYPTILNGAISGSSFTNSKVDSAVTAQTYPSGSWTVASGTTEATGIAFTVRLYGILHNNRTFIIITFAPTSSATADQTTYFDPMLSSLVFLT